MGMTKRYSDTLRERAQEKQATTRARLGYIPEAAAGYAIALREIADEIDQRFSGKLVYEQRNAALEEVARLKRRAADLEDAIAMACEEPVSGCECAGCENARQYGVGDETNQEDG